MRNSGNKFPLMFVLLLGAQVLVCNFFSFTPYLTISILPALIMCIGIEVSTLVTLPVAFVCGLSVDFLADGVLGLNALALVPVALVQKRLISLVLGKELLVRGENFSFKTKGAGRVAFLVSLASALFFAIYITVDGAGTRPLWFNLVRFAGSVLVSLPLEIVAVNILTSRED